MIGVILVNNWEVESDYSAHTVNLFPDMWSKRGSYFSFFHNSMREMFRRVHGA